jgi:hypothetical protein
MFKIIMLEFGGVVATRKRKTRAEAETAVTQWARALDPRDEAQVAGRDRYCSSVADRGWWIEETVPRKAAK